MTDIKVGSSVKEVGILQRLSAKRRPPAIETVNIDTIDDAELKGLIEEKLMSLKEENEILREKLRIQEEEMKLRTEEMNKVKDTLISDSRKKVEKEIDIRQHQIDSLKKKLEKEKSTSNVGTKKVVAKSSQSSRRSKE